MKLTLYTLKLLAIYSALGALGWEITGWSRSLAERFGAPHWLVFASPLISGFVLLVLFAIGMDVRAQIRDRRSS